MEDPRSKTTSGGVPGAAWLDVGAQRRPLVLGGPPRVQLTVGECEGPPLAGPPARGADTGTLAAVTTRISQFGSLSERRGGSPDPRPSPRIVERARGEHVWVMVEPGDWRPGVLAAWSTGEGQWWARVAVVGVAGALEELLVAAARVRPAETSVPPST